MPNAKVLEIEKRRADRLEAQEKDEENQYAVDLEAREELDAEHGKTAAVKVPFRKGLPTRAFVRTPDRGEYKRYTDCVFRGVADKKPAAVRAAAEDLAHACWVYPRTAEERDAMLEAYPGILSSLGTVAAKLAEGKTDEEGKD